MYLLGDIGFAVDSNGWTNLLGDGTFDRMQLMTEIVDRTLDIVEILTARGHRAYRVVEKRRRHSFFLQ